MESHHLALMGVYHLCLYGFRRKDPSAAWFGLFCLLVALRTVLTENRFLTWLFPDFSWELVFLGELLTVHLSFLALVLFIRSLYPAECSPRVVRPLLGICAGFALVAVATRARTSSLLVAPFHPVIFLILAYVVFVLIQAIRHRRPAVVLVRFSSHASVRRTAAAVAAIRPLRAVAAPRRR